MLNNVPISRKLPAAIVIMALVCATVVGVLSYQGMNRAISAEAESQLLEAVKSRADMLEEAEASSAAGLELMASDFSMGSAVIALVGGYKSVFDKAGLDGLEQVRAYLEEKERNPDALAMGDISLQNYIFRQDRWHPWLKRTAFYHGFDNFYILNPDGDVIYTAVLNDLFGQNAVTGAAASSPLGQVVRQAIADVDAERPAQVHVSNFHEDGHLNGELASHFAIAAHDANGRFVGILAADLSIGAFDELLSRPLGMKYPLHTILVGPDANVLTGHVIGHDADMSTFLQSVDGSPIARTAISVAEEIGERSLTDGKTYMYGVAQVQLQGGDHGLIIEAEKADVLATVLSLRNAIIIVVLASAVVIGFVGTLFARGITRPLDRMKEALREIAETRDLTNRIRLNSTNEIGRSSSAVDEILGLVDGAFGEFRNSTDEVSGVAKRMSNASQNLAGNAESQTAAIEELSSSVEQTSHQLRSNAEAAREAADVVSTTASIAIEGKERVTGMVSAMNDISASSQDIAKIIKVIDEIAFQTNLLALNAAVEAARAGQHGRGFAVVASEVRNLAARSAKAAKETSDLIESSNRRVEVGVTISNQTSQSFEQIAEDIQRVEELVKNISTSTVEQSRGVDLINESISDIARIAHATNGEAESIAATATQLNGSNDRLQTQISRFRSSATGSQNAPAQQQPQQAPAASGGGSMQPANMAGASSRTNTRGYGT